MDTNHFWTSVKNKMDAIKILKRMSSLRSEHDISSTISLTESTFEI